jgi:diguanylate cyclase (GGDEF)-like protein
MLFPSLYEELNMGRYARVVADMLPDRNILIALCDDTGQIVWASDVVGMAQQKSIKQCREQQSANEFTGGSACVECKQSGARIIYSLLGELAGRSAGELVFVDTCTADDSSKVHGNLVPKLRNIAEMIKSELYNLYEVNAMAIELGERYDELSMLRSSDLALAEYHESRHILSSYIRNCAEHLNADYAAIWILARNAIYPGGKVYTHNSAEILLLLKQQSLSAHELFQEGYEGFGINDKDEQLRHAIQLPADKKLLIVPVLDGNGKPIGVLSCINEFYSRDFTNSDKSTLEAVSRKTYKYLLDTQDELTGLLNRKGFEESVWREISMTESELYIVMFNIDQFSIVNAAYGITTGDSVLQLIAGKINESAGGLKCAARLEADSFVILVESRARYIEDLAKNICDEIDNINIAVKGKKLSLSSRAGVIACNSKETALADHLYAAEIAIASAKEASNDRVVVYKPGNTALMKRKKQLTQVENIKHALQEDRFELYCQRIEPLTGGETHYEILVRMVDEKGELVPPDEFIPVAERYNLMHKVDRWIIKRVFQLLSNNEYREQASQYKWGINLSGMTLGDDGFHDYVSECLREYDFLPTSLYFEITETAAIKNFQNCIAFMNEVHSMGVQFALDDFGSGLSSFSYLKKLSIDYLKIDGSLVRDIINSRLDQTMVSAISEIANVMGVKTIAEYVENGDILEKLRIMKIDYVQGYEIMRPQPVELELKNLCEHAKYKLHISN